jgi:hypothetical protein
MTILVVLVGMLAGLAWFLPDAEAQEKNNYILASTDDDQENPRA